MTSLPTDLLRRFDHAGPRYTSYPTADRFVEAFGEQDLRQALALRSQGGSLRRPLSVYVHVPFCESVCYYCACNKVVTRQHGRAAAYLDDLEREMALYAEALGTRATVSHVHLGGGTPTFLSDAELQRLMDALRHHFTLAPGGEYAVEVDPRTVTPGRLAVLQAIGFNRLSFGVQDFDPGVQRAVHRVQPAEDVFALVATARALGFESINCDVIYGLPRQTPVSFARTLEQLRALRPDRVALYAYAHLPERFKPQRRIQAAELPAPADKVGMLAAAIDVLGQAGYDYIGMDHFALANDALAVARRQGRLHRNFQGYSTQPDGDLIGLGASAIGRIGATYTQNAKSLEDYRDPLAQGRLPVARGIALGRDDLLRHAAIMALMCQGRIDFDAFGAAHLVDARAYFARELAALAPMTDAGLLALDAGGITVSPRGWFCVRAIAMVFDRYLQADRDRSRYSRVM